MATQRTRLTPVERRQQIVNVAVTMASKVGGLHGLTREAIAREVGCSEALVSLYCGEMGAFKRIIMRKAIREKILPIIAQGIVLGDPLTKRLSSDLKNEALAVMG